MDDDFEDLNEEIETQVKERIDKEEEENEKRK